MEISAGMTVAVVGGGCGAGATTLACGLAVRAHAARRTVVAVDADPAGGGLDVALGIETEQGVRWPELQGAAGALDGARLIERLPADRDGLAVLSHGRQWRPMPGALTAGALDALAEVSELVVVDVGRSLPEEQLAEVLDRCRAVLLVARGTATGLAAAGATVDRLGVPVQLVVRDLPARLSAEVGQSLGVPVVTAIASDRRLEADAARGVPPGARERSDFAGRCDEILRDLLIGRAAA
ncbi:hypothetical protein HJ588_01895 [Flexivirga sp. ID2601S]|uniref:Uncharacterized protein n=1 Tax=Flexivirga aerilata TaxID=1656889 RepID=A0A849AC18_9MICO|nr:septum site-determining protein Ssd [Flexivirga aerilata]NNG38029.1 hypothetical protein [Flexivirga aerilata]